MALTKYRLQDIAEVVGGGTPSTLVEENYGGEIVWITPKDLSNQNSKFIEQGERSISDKGFNSCSAQMIPAYNILMSSRAPIGLLAINKVECCTNQGFKSLILNKSICDVDYIYYYLKHHFQEIEGLGTGTTFKEVSKGSLLHLGISIPPLEEQQIKARLLSCIDAKIALNRSINHNLEAMAKQLYDYWFVQFDFPDENGKPYKSSGGKMVWNEKLKREIPEGWNVVSLSQYLETYVEKVSPKSINPNDRYAPIEVIPRRKMSFWECTPIENAISGLCRFQRKHILLSNRRVYFHKVCIAAFSGLTRDTVIVLKPTLENILGYAYQLINDDMFIKYAARHSYGSEQPVLSWEAAKSYKVLKPSNRLDATYSEFIVAVIEHILRNEMAIDGLTTLRDSLLPLLMNGQVSVNYDLSTD